MLDAERMAGLADLVAGHHEAAAARLLDRLAVSLVSGGRLAVEDEWALRKAAELNARAVEEILTGHGPAMAESARRAVERALREADAADVAAAARAGVALPRASPAVRRLIDVSSAALRDALRLTALSMGQSAQALWLDAAAEAVTARALGAEPLEAVTERAVRRLSREGLSVIDYASGTRTSVDAAIRRHVVTITGRAACEIAIERAREAGHDLVRVSAHFGARPEHAVWQGGVYSLSGATPGYRGLADATGYGDTDGLGGVNCGHTLGPHWPGVTETDELPSRAPNGMTGAELYEAVQTQGRLERAVRRASRDAALSERAGLDAAPARLSEARAMKRLAAWCARKKLPRRPLRERAYGVVA